MGDPDRLRTAVHGTRIIAGGRDLLRLHNAAPPDHPSGTPVRTRCQRVLNTEARVVNPGPRELFQFAPVDMLGHTVMMSECEKDRQSLLETVAKAGRVTDRALLGLRLPLSGPNFGEMRRIQADLRPMRGWIVPCCPASGGARQTPALRPRPGRSGWPP